MANQFYYITIALTVKLNDKETRIRHLTKLASVYWTLPIVI